MRIISQVCCVRLKPVSVFPSSFLQSRTFNIAFSATVLTGLALVACSFFDRKSDLEHNLFACKSSKRSSRSIQLIQHSEPMGELQRKRRAFFDELKNCSRIMRTFFKKLASETFSGLCALLNPKKRPPGATEDDFVDDNSSEEGSVIGPPKSQSLFEDDSSLDISLHSVASGSGNSSPPSLDKTERRLWSQQARYNLRNPQGSDTGRRLKNCDSSRSFPIGSRSEVINAWMQPGFYSPSDELQLHFDAQTSSPYTLSSQNSRRGSFCSGHNPHRNSSLGSEESFRWFELNSPVSSNITPPPGGSFDQECQKEDCERFTQQRTSIESQKVGRVLTPQPIRPDEIEFELKDRETVKTKEATSPYLTPQENDRKHTGLQRSPESAFQGKIFLSKKSPKGPPGASSGQHLTEREEWIDLPASCYLGKKSFEIRYHCEQDPSSKSFDFIAPLTRGFYRLDPPD